MYSSLDEYVWRKMWLWWSKIRFLPQMCSVRISILPLQVLSIWTKPSITLKAQFDLERHFDLQSSSKELSIHWGGNLEELHCFERKNQTNEPHPSVFTWHCSHLPSLRPYCRSVMKIFRNAGHFRFSIDGPLTLGTSGPASFVESFESSEQVKTPQSYSLSRSRHHKVFVWASQDTMLFWANPLVTLQVFTRSTSLSLTFTVIFPSKGAGGGLSHIGPRGMVWLYKLATWQAINLSTNDNMIDYLLILLTRDTLWPLC